jgi:hypothetical protein
MSIVRQVKNIELKDGGGGGGGATYIFTVSKFIIYALLLNGLLIDLVASLLAKGRGTHFAVLNKLN